MAFEHRKWTIFALFCLFLLLDMFIGFRLGAAVAGISIFTLWLSKQGRRRLILYYWKQLSLGFIFTASLFFYKELSFAVKMADFNLLKSILSEPDTYRAALAHSEPFITQNILNEVILQQYHIGTEHLMGLVYQLILFSPELGLDISSFNDLFQNDLFPEVNYGMANNIWAEMWSSGGWPLLLIFIIIFLFFLKLFSVLTTSKNITQRTIISVMAAYWAFYIHRNDINYQIVLEKRVILILIASLICAFLIRQLRVLKNNNYRLRKEGDNNQHHTD